MLQGVAGYAYLFGMEAKQMSPEAQRIAIAEACGWIKVGRSLAGLGGFPPSGYEKHPLPSPEDHSENWRIRYGKSPGNQWFSLPDYLNDLNAMAKAEKWLRGTDQQYYNDVEFYNRWAKYSHYVFRSFGISATATQRAEGFLRILGKWEEA